MISSRTLGEMSDTDTPPVVLGIDTGGTYTDAVLVAPGRRILAAAKALTTPNDLSLGVVEAIDRLDPSLTAAVRRVCLSTTLATNAMVEGKGARVFLILLGHDASVIERFDLSRLITRYPLTAANSALADMEAGRVMKPVLEVRRG